LMPALCNKNPAPFPFAEQRVSPIEILSWQLCDPEARTCAHLSAPRHELEPILLIDHNLSRKRHRSQPVPESMRLLIL
jgi:hypothetical protein